ncbi:oxidoreductase family, NAD-binding Rossmann fold-domain-containing protein [Aspergillus insuetus]
MASQAQKTKVLVALVGGGTIAPLHAKYLLSSHTCSLSAIIDPFPPGQKLAAQLSIPHFDSLESLTLSRVQTPEAYIICVPSSLHVQVATDVITHGSPKAILIEKPFCTDSKAGRKLLGLAKAKSCQILTTKKPGSYYTFAGWRSSRSAGGGPIWTNFVHDIDVLHYLTGSRIIRVWATPTIRCREKNSVALEDLVEEGAAVMLQFANGVVGTFIVSDNVASPFSWEATTGDNPLYPPAPETLTEPDGVIWTYDAADPVDLGSEVGWNVPIQREVLQRGDGIPFQQQAEHLARVVRQGEKPRCSGEDGLAAVKVCEDVITALVAGDGIPIVIQL